MCHPVAITIIPQPTCTTGSEIPKNARIWVAIKTETTSKIKLLSAIRCESKRRDSGEYSRVSARKIGLPPSGLNMGKSALRKRIVVSTASSSNAASELRSIAEFQGTATEQRGPLFLGPLPGAVVQREESSPS